MPRRPGMGNLVAPGDRDAGGLVGERLHAADLQTFVHSKPEGHIAQVPQRHRALAVVDIADFAVLEELQHRWSRLSSRPSFSAIAINVLLTELAMCGISAV
jgi:hypothetical protein